MEGKHPREDDYSQRSPPPSLKRRKTFHLGLENALPPDQYTVAWICALYTERAAACAMLDEVHGDLPGHLNDKNSYTLGSIEQHNIVIACLPEAGYGTNNASRVLTELMRTFSSIRIGLMVGIAGGVPTRADLRLGDVVVGSRVMEYELGKIVGDGKVERKATPKIPDQLLLTLVSNIRSRHELDPSRVPSILREKMEYHTEYNRPSTPDRLFVKTYAHPSLTSDCTTCDQSKLAPRSTRVTNDPTIHYGAIASGNKVVKDATARDDLARELDVICFEMEAAGLMDVLPCLPIRGICDYSDSHKAKEWQRYAAATAAAYARELLEVLPAPKVTGKLRGANDLLDEAPQDASLERRQRLMESLRFDQIDSRRTTIKTAHGKTCDWFLKLAEYQQWLNPRNQAQHHGFLWLRGKPGAGKSTIMKFIYLKTKRTTRQQDTITASFFFNARGEYLEKSIGGMYRSLLLQLLEGFPDLQQVFDDTDLVPKGHNGCPSLNVLKDLLHDAVSRLGKRSFTCFVDALDECDEQQAMDMIQYFEDLAEDCTMKGVRLRICFSSRHYPYIHIRRGLQLTLENQLGHDEDLSKYVESYLRIRDQTLVLELQPHLVEKASGVFLWVILVVDILNKENRKGRLALKKRLAEVPAGLSELFKDILERDTSNKNDLLLSVLWILYAKRPLQPKEFYHALWSGSMLEGRADPEIPDVTVSDAQECIESHVITSSKGLAEITKAKQPTVQFIHESVRDFLIKDGGLRDLWPDLVFDRDSPSHDKLKQCCSLYISQPSVIDCVGGLSPDHNRIEWKSQTAEISKGLPFLEYASEHVLYHADAAAKAVPQEEFLSGFSVSRWIDLANRFEKHKIRRFSQNASLLYLLAERGFSELIRTRLRADPRIDVRGERYQYPLFAALAIGNRDAVAALLELPSTVCDGVDIMEGFGHRQDLSAYEDRTPLSWAAQEGLTGIVKVLLSKGADANEEDLGGQTPLVRASKHGYHAVSMLLLSHGADITEVAKSDSNGLTPLVYASLNGHHAFVMSLIKEGLDIKASHTDAAAPLWIVANSGLEDLTRQLLESGADPNARISSMSAQAPLYSVSKSGHVAVARLLIEKGADVNTCAYNGKSALCAATEGNHLEMVQLLINKGAHVNLRGEMVLLPLIEAMRLNNDAIARYLIERGADIEGRGEHNRTPLHAASENGNITAMQLLLDHGANIETRNDSNETPLHLASAGGNVQVVQLLLDRGANIEARDQSNQRPLHLASARYRLEVVQLLLDHEENIETRNESI
ncbi:hypothetical protein FZEAL_6157 [Fusarium zealandicum]|uniref:Nucleoside phosphorylase domain-containing protein n=1 Tax=Fusarium zealandicum TaxID=1053134 RepID=A0A8H4UI92_9HYPO|nr:hypothetical protein FZEAL_6157 [Fusarium zealandicum]